MYVDFMLRRRPRLEEERETLNAHFVDQFRQVEGFWVPGGSTANARVEVHQDAAALDLRKSLALGLGGGQLVYCPRFAGWINDDRAATDDFLKFRLDSEKVNYSDFCNSVLPRLIGIFLPYRVRVESNEKVAIQDWEFFCTVLKKTRRDYDGREGIYRFWPVSYFDDALCNRSYGISAAEVVQRASPACRYAKVLHGGAFLMLTPEIVVDESLLNELSNRVKRHLPHDKVLQALNDITGLENSVLHHGCQL